MKKFLLLASGALLAAGSMMAAPAEPEVFENYGLMGISPDNRYTVSSLYDTLTILDLENYSDYEYQEMYDIGTGNFMSATGVVVGQSEGVFAAWWQNGKWKPVNSETAERMSVASGITPDGSRIVGSIAPADYTGDHEGLMLMPCYWDLQNDGTYSETHVLPFPQKDFTGRVPQYITAICISDDGKTIAGQMVDYSGSVRQPIVYTLGADGEWAYTLIHNNLYHPEGFTLPEDPGEAPNVQPESFMTQEEIAEYEKAVQDYYDRQDSIVYPEISDYMTEEEWAAYSKALDEYYENWENYPEYEDYMTAEEFAAYNKAIDDYYEAMNANQYPEYADFMTEEEIAAWDKAKELGEEWDEKWMEFSEAFNELCEIVPSFVFNNVILSADGSTLASTRSRELFDWDSWNFISEYHPWVFNLQDNTIKAFDDMEEQLIVSSMAADGTLMGQERGDELNPPTYAYVLAPEADEFILLTDYFAVANPAVAEWIKENMTVEYTKYTLDEDTWEFIPETAEATATGIPFISYDKTLLALTVENFWDYESGVTAYGYIIPTGLSIDAVEGIADAACSVKAALGGILTLKGEFSGVQVYDMSGCKVFSSKNPAETVDTGLKSGVYVVRAVTASGTPIVLKAVF